MSDSLGSSVLARTRPHSFSCGSHGAYCAQQKSATSAEAASIDGEFTGKATFYNETQAGSEFSTCGTVRGRSLSDSDEKIYTAALNHIQFDPYTVDGIPSNNPICEKRAIVKGPQGEITVRFVDRCDTCENGKTPSQTDSPLISRSSSQVPSLYPKKPSSRLPESSAMANPASHGSSSKPSTMSSVTQLQRERNYYTITRNLSSHFFPDYIFNTNRFLRSILSTIYQ